MIIGLTKAIIIHLPEAFVPVVSVCTCARARLISMLIVASCAGVGCFQCPLFGLPDRTLLSGRAREGERPLNNVLMVSFSQHSPLCSGYRDSCLIYSPKGTAGDHAAFVWPHRRFPSPRCGCKTCALPCMPFLLRIRHAQVPYSIMTRKANLCYFNSFQCYRKW